MHMILAWSHLYFSTLLFVQFVKASHFLLLIFYIIQMYVFVTYILKFIFMFLVGFFTLWKITSMMYTSIDSARLH